MTAGSGIVVGACMAVHAMLTELLSGWVVGNVAEAV